MGAPAADPAARQRLDKWLWQARFFKSRGLAAEIVSGGHVRLNGQHARKPAQGVRPGDVLTFPQARRIRVVRVEALGTRRGPATEAQALYTDLTPPEPPKDQSAPRPGPAPDRRERAVARRLRGSALD